MLLQRRSQIYRSQSVSAAESVFSSVSFLIRIRELLLVLKASKKIASNPPFPSPPNPSLHLALRSFSLPFFSLFFSRSVPLPSSLLFPSPPPPTSSGIGTTVYQSLSSPIRLSIIDIYCHPVSPFHLYIPSPPLYQVSKPIEHTMDRCTRFSKRLTNRPGIPRGNELLFESSSCACDGKRGKSEKKKERYSVMMAVID